jgi:hypothetical protein
MAWPAYGLEAADIGRASGPSPVDSTAMSDYTDRLKAIGERVSAARGFL